ncbi:hypothetical protein BASA60_000755 [Batrachochytrium salamandrivorans]|nr:hypothetical protein BASA60_000755 [Batrachochytrium salamandrivorans]
MADMSELATSSSSDGPLYLKQATLTIVSDFISLLKVLTPKQFTAESVILPHSTVGKHIRHTLDHFLLLLASLHDPISACIADADNHKSSFNHTPSRVARPSSLEGQVSTDGHEILNDSDKKSASVSETSMKMEGKDFKNNLSSEQGDKYILVDYDARKRQASLETDLEIAIAELGRVSEKLQCALSVLDMDTPADVLATTTTEGKPVVLKSSVGREIWFTLHHAIHHGAMIRAISIELGIAPSAIPPTLGIAPSTIQHHSCK